MPYQSPPPHPFPASRYPDKVGPHSYRARRRLIINLKLDTQMCPASAPVTTSYAASAVGCVAVTAFVVPAPPTNIQFGCLGSVCQLRKRSVVHRDKSPREQRQHQPCILTQFSISLHSISIVSQAVTHSAGCERNAAACSQVQRGKSARRSFLSDSGRPAQLAPSGALRAAAVEPSLRSLHICDQLQLQAPLPQAAHRKRCSRP